MTADYRDRAAASREQPSRQSVDDLHSARSSTMGRSRLFRVGYAERVREANSGRPVDVVLESTGGAVFSAALDVLAYFGRLVSYGDLLARRATGKVVLRP